MRLCSDISNCPMAYTSPRNILFRGVLFFKPPPRQYLYRKLIYFFPSSIHQRINKYPFFAILYIVLLLLTYLTLSYATNEKTALSSGFLLAGANDYSVLSHRVAASVIGFADRHTPYALTSLSNSLHQKFSSTSSIANKKGHLNGDLFHWQGQ